MNTSFNLIDQPWIPCLAAGKSQLLSLSDTLGRAHQLDTIWVSSAVETAAMHRLLLAVLHRVFGPKSTVAWAEMWRRGRFDTASIDAYLSSATIYPRFDLFDATRPFLQADDPRARENSILRLIPKAASGNNPTLFDHSQEAAGIALTPAEAARALIAAQAFSVGGLSGIKSENFTDAPCATAIVFLARGTTLFETLMLNLVRYGEDEPLPTLNNDDAPAWEMVDPLQPPRTQPKGYLDYLTWHSRRIWLIPEAGDGGIVVRRMRWAPGLHLANGQRDPLVHYQPDKKAGFIPLRFTADRVLWRDSSALFQLDGEQRVSGVLEWIAGLVGPPHRLLDETHRYRLMALGMAKNKASLEFLRAEELPLPMELLGHPERVAAMAHALKQADRAAEALQLAVFVLAWLTLYPATPLEKIEKEEQIHKKRAAGRATNSNDKDARRIYLLYRSWQAESTYWVQLEVPFFQMVEALDSGLEVPLAVWRETIWQTACAAFAQTAQYTSHDQRTMRATGVADQWFNRSMGRALGPRETSDKAQLGEQTT